MEKARPVWLGPDGSALPAKLTLHAFTETVHPRPTAAGSELWPTKLTGQLQCCAHTKQQTHQLCCMLACWRSTLL